MHPRRRVHPRPHQFHQSCVEVDRHDIQAEQIRKGKRIADHRRKALCFGPVWSLLHIEYWFPAYRYRRYSAQMKYFERLTARERQCLELLSAPMRPKEIALHLSLSVKTVEAHLASAKAKLSANSTLHASRLYREYLESAPENVPKDIVRIEADPAIEPDQVGPGSSEPVQVGREINLGWQLRTAIIVSLAFAVVLSILMLVAGAEGITRIQHNYVSVKQRS